MGRVIKKGTSDYFNMFLIEKPGTVSIKKSFN